MIDSLHTEVLYCRRVDIVDSSVTVNLGEVGLCLEVIAGSTACM